MVHGRCHCGAIRFEMPEQVVFSTVCHCTDCRRQSGAPVSAWAMVPAASLRVHGTPNVYQSSETGRRSFCGVCGTGLFFSNAPLEGMGMVQVRIAALDEPDAVPPRMQVQAAEQIAWMGTLHAVPAVERYPG